MIAHIFYSYLGNYINFYGLLAQLEEIVIAKYQLGNIATHLIFCDPLNL